LSFLTYLITKIPRNLDQESLKVIETGTGAIQQTDYGFLLVFYRNFVPNTHRDLETGAKVTEGH